MKNVIRWSVLVGVLVSVVTVAFSTMRPAEAAESLDTPIAFQLCVADGADAIVKCNAVGSPAAYQVPAARVLLVEQVSGDCGSDAQPGLALYPALAAQTGGVLVNHWVVGIPNPNQPGGLIPSTLTRVYADPGSTFTIDLTRVPAGSLGRFCRISVSGRLVKP